MIMTMSSVNESHKYFELRMTDKRGNELFDFEKRNTLVIVNETFAHHVVKTHY